MELRRIIHSGIAASAVVHLSLLAMVLIYAEVHPFGSVTTEPIAVDIVSPEEAAPKPEPPPAPKPSDLFDLPAQSATAAQPAAAAAPAPATPSQKQAAPATPRPARQQAAIQPAPPPSATAAPTPSFVPPQPDLSIKYHVQLGLPQALPPANEGPRDRPGDGFDAPASATADVASSFVTEFRQRLKTCSKLPPSIGAADPLKIKLRVLMTPEGKLAATPVLIEASASAKGLLLMQSAISALEACQPYAMLPRDRYGEWKALDLSFTPEDFVGG